MVICSKCAAVAEQGSFCSKCGGPTLALRDDVVLPEATSAPPIAGTPAPLAEVALKQNSVFTLLTPLNQLPRARRHLNYGCLAILILMGAFAFWSSISGPTVNAPASRATNPTSISPGAGLSMDNFNRIQTGMTYSQVVAILGSDGEEISRSDLAGYTTVMYMWKRWTGANMNATFQNGRLVSKAQMGL